MYAIVDLETTGAFSGSHKITEIAIVKFDGKKVVETFETLVNPERSIPQSIEQFTGISNTMVMHAPPFYKIAKEVVEHLKDCVFVAHNVSFDYGVLRSEFKELGYTFNTEKMCTVRLARKVFPGQDSYSLGKLCASLGIPLKNRHRAMGDAQATVKLFEKILKQSSQEDFEQYKKQDELLLPPQIHKRTVEALPEECGIYIFKNKSSETIYIGKSKNIQSRVKQHFRYQNGKRKAIALRDEVFSIETILTYHDLSAKLLECHLIKQERPKFNRSLNRVRFRYYLSLEKDEKSFFTPVLKTPSQFNTDYEKKVIYFHSKQAAQKAIANLYQKSFGLKVDGLNFEKQKQMFQKSLGVKTYNSKLKHIFLEYFYPHENFDAVFQISKAQYNCIEYRANQINAIKCYKHNELIAEFSLEESSDIKNIFLSAYQKYPMKINAYSE